MLSVELFEETINVSEDVLALYNEELYKNKKPHKKVFEKFIKFAEHYNSLDNKIKKIYDDLGTLRGAKLKAAQINVKNWYEDLVKDLTTAEEIYEFINLAEICGNETMFTLSCFTLADDLEKLQTVEAIRKKYNIQNDLTDTELEQLRKEDEIWNTIKED